MKISGDKSQLRVLHLYALMHGWKLKETRDYYQVQKGSQRSFVLDFCITYYVNEADIKPSYYFMYELLNRSTVGTLNCSIDKDKIYEFVKTKGPNKI